MSRFENTFRSAVANAERDVLIAQIRANPQMTLSELGKLTSGELGPLLKGLTIGDLISAATGDAAPAAATDAAPVISKSTPKATKRRGRKAKAPKAAKTAAAKAPAKTAAAKAPKAKAPVVEVETRTATGRALYDESVLSAIRGFGKPMSAEELRASVGGTPLQARAALARLINAGAITWEGKARGTRYSETKS